jgi:hypothetical protein
MAAVLNMAILDDNIILVDSLRVNELCLETFERWLEGPLERGGLGIVWQRLQASSGMTL